MDDLDTRAHANLVGFVGFQGRLDPTTQVLDKPGAFAIRGATDFPSTRIAIRRDDSLEPERFADVVSDFLLDGGRFGCVYVRPDTDPGLLEVMIDRGFVEFSRSPEMVCEARLADVRPPDGVTVRLAQNAEDVRAYAEIAGHAFRHLQLRESITRDTVDHPSVMLGDDVAVALAEIDGRPVAGACSILFGAEPDGYVGWVACHDDARGRGLGDVVTRRVTNEAFDRGAGIVTLEASPFGEHTYARMGYREIYRYATLIKL